MFGRFLIAASAATLGLYPFASADAANISVGSGVDSIEVYLNWSDGFIAPYTVHYGSTSGDAIGVYDASQDAAAVDSNLSLAWDNFPFPPFDPNYFLRNASFTGGHANDSSTTNFTTDPDGYWHEYTDTGSGWVFGNGASVDVLNNGDKVGWVFGSAALPVPEPALLPLFGAAVMIIQRRQRND